MKWSEVRFTLADDGAACSRCEDWTRLTVSLPDGASGPYCAGCVLGPPGPVPDLERHSDAERLAAMRESRRVARDRRPRGPVT